MGKTGEARAIDPRQVPSLSWVRLDDSMPDDEKVAALSDGAFRAYVSAICFSARMLTDGRLTARNVAAFTGRRSKQLLQELAPGLWHEPGMVCPSPHCDSTCDLKAGEFLIHNYLKYNPTKQKVLAERAAAQARTNAARSARVQANKRRTFA